MEVVNGGNSEEGEGENDVMVLKFCAYPCDVSIGDKIRHFAQVSWVLEESDVGHSHVYHQAAFLDSGNIECFY